MDVLWVFDPGRLASSHKAGIVRSPSRAGEGGFEALTAVDDGVGDKPFGSAAYYTPPVR